MLREWTGTAPVSRDWFTSSADEHAEHMSQDAGVKAHAAHAGHGAPLETVFANAQALKLAPPVILTPPAGSSSYWWAKSNAQNRPQREDVALSAITGEVVRRDTFGAKRIIDQIVGYGIAGHEGQLFGPLNQALGVLRLSASSRCASAPSSCGDAAPRQARWASPPPIPDARIGIGLAAIIVVAGVLLPVLGASLLVLGLLEAGLLRRWPAARRWLGLQSA